MSHLIGGGPFLLLKSKDNDDHIITLGLQQWKRTCRVVILQTLHIQTRVPVIAQALLAIQNETLLKNMVSFELL